MRRFYDFEKEEEKLYEAAKKVSQDLYADLYCMNLTHYTQDKALYIERQNKLLKEYPKSKAELYRQSCFAFYYSKLNQNSKKIVDCYVELLESRVFYYSYGFIRSDRSRYYYVHIQSIVGFVKQCLMLQLLKLDMVQYLKGFSYFEASSDFVESDYIACQLSLEGNDAILDVLSGMIYDNEGLLQFSTNVIRGMLLSTSEKAQDMVMDLLKAAKLSEGLRQAIVENIDFAENSVYKRFLTYIYDENLIRFSSVKRALNCFTGLEGLVDEKRHSLIFEGIYKCLLNDQTEVYLQSESALEVYLGLYALATNHVEGAFTYISEQYSLAKDYIKAVYIFFLRKCHYNISGAMMNQLIMETHNDKLLGSILTLCDDVLYFTNEEDKVNYIKNVSSWLDQLKSKPKGYYILDESISLTIDYTGSIQLMMSLSHEIDDLYELSYKHADKMSYGKGFSEVRHPFVREKLITLLAAPTDNLRSFTFKKINELNLILTQQEYELIGSYLKSKRSDVRKNISQLFQSAPPEILLNCCNKLLEDKDRQKQLGAFSILVENKERLSTFTSYADIVNKLDKFSDDVELKSYIEILTDQEVQITQVNQELYETAYYPELLPLNYNKKSVKNFLNPDEKSMLSFFKKIIEICEQLKGVEVEVLKYDHTKEIKQFGFDICSIQLKKYLYQEQATYSDYIFYEQFLHLEQEIEDREIALWGCFARLLLHVQGMEWSGRKEEDVQTFNELISLKYYPQLKKINKYLSQFEEKILRHHLNSIVNVLEILNLYKISQGKERDPSRLDFFMDVYSYMVDKDKTNKSKVKVSAFNDVVRGLALCPENWDNHNSRRYFDVRFYLEQIRNNPINSIPYQELLNFVEKGYLKVDYLYKLMFDVQEHQERYSKTSNAIAIIQHWNHHWNYRVGKDKMPELGIEIFNRVIQEMLKVELDRTESDTLYTNALMTSHTFSGVHTFLEAVFKMGSIPFVRGYSWVSGGKKNAFSHIIYYCSPKETDTQELFDSLVKKYRISEQKLLEATMYNLKFIEFTEKYLGVKGLKKAAYYFKAHMKENFQEEDQTIIRRYTDIEFSDLALGQMDMKWFRESYLELGEREFMKVYESSKYITSGGNHKRAQYFADAVLGRLEEAAVLERINDKRNQDMVLAYGLIPLGENPTKDAVRRYKRLQNFIKESKQFGAQRKVSELSKATVALQNLSRTYGFSDVNRFVWNMEIEIISELKEFFEFKTIEDIRVKLTLENPANPSLYVEKNNKELKSLPKQYKNNEHIGLLNEAKKELKEQHQRAIVSFENAMIDEDVFIYEELLNLSKHPFISLILHDVLFVFENQIGFIRDNGMETLEATIPLDRTAQLKIAHPIELYETGKWPDWQNHLMNQMLKQPFKQVFRELYVMTEEEKSHDGYTNRFAGYQVEGKRMLGIMKSRNWVINEYEGFEKVSHKHNVRVDLYCYADWFTPSEIESPSIEKVVFMDNKYEKSIDMKELSKVMFSEVMRDLDLVVSVAHVGGVDVLMNHSTIEMRQRILAYNMNLLNISNYHITGHHIQVMGSYGNYTIHLGSGIVHMENKGMLPIFPVHSQHRGKIFLPFVDEDPKTAEIVTKVLMLANDQTIKDPSILCHLK